MMKSAIFLLLTFLIPAQVFAEMKFPAGVFRMTQLDQAMDEANKQKKPLFLVYGDHTHESDPQHLEHLEDTLKAGSEWSVTVYISLKDEILMSPILEGAVKGGSLPMVFIATPEADKVFTTITPPSGPIEPKDLRKHVRAEINACKTEIAAWFAAKPAHRPELPGDRTMLWLNQTRNTTEEGVFDRVENGKLYLRIAPNLPKSSIDLADLNPATRRYLRYITGTDKQTKAQEETAPPLKKWTNTLGKTLEASFLSLKDGKVTLKTAAGKEYVLALETLSPESQEQARRLSADGAQKK
jgi:hypothetical protein